MFNPEFEKYKSFIEQYYPESGVISNPVIREIYNSVNKSINFMKMIKNIDSTINSERKKLYNDFNLIHLRVLYHLPSNDVFINNILVRLTSENILRLAVSFINPQSDSISNMTYSQMIEELKQKGFPQRYPDLYNNITNYFGRYSKDVHGETIHRYSENDLLMMIRKKKDVKSLASLSKVYENIVDDIVPFFLKELSTEKTKIETPVLSQMYTILGEDIYNQFF
ncbi:hypothetical protein JSQ81_16370 [Sporosarcina sp. Marseille-Q4063]|uniref:hypothetical protein n=1 Tax=Sporosarcina sp. Marseille-Q4063 TaxID=2810514 RepID=UPI001BAFF9A8|nr:hypothetical protein [Sporosarcina sp. Marseille-Q4063]QUW21363.1 hypothetical protein JSQ81_16370 [Sporosarcina sp. Marseille-Q4063]